MQKRVAANKIVIICDRETVVTSVNPGGKRMEKTKRRAISKTCLIALVLVAALTAALFWRSNIREPLEIESLSAVQCENLNTLCRV